MKIGFIGAGNMAKAIISGIIKSNFLSNSDIYINTRTFDKADELKSTYNINIERDKKQLVMIADIIILAVKPNQYETVINDIKKCDLKNKVFVSIAAGLSLDKIKNMFGDKVKLIRCMPNTPVSVGEGMTGICKNELVSEEELMYVTNLFNTIGRAEVIEEKMMDAVVAVSGSSPAYIYMIIEAMADAAVLEGMPRDKAYIFASQAVLGSAKLVLDSGIHPGELKDKVCSPGGTTIEAVRVLEEKGLRSSIIEAMKACVDKSKELG